VSEPTTAASQRWGLSDALVGIALVIKAAAAMTYLIGLVSSQPSMCDPADVQWKCQH
jgi:hypothetical protein